MNRFFSNVDVKGPDDCWNWKGGINSAGYGQCYYFGRYNAAGAHRVSWIITNGEVPSGKLILHKCDNKLCCNPNHLYCGTYKDNQNDIVERNPTSANKFGNKHAKLHSGEIWLIRKLKVPKDRHTYGKYKFPINLVAKMFKVSPTTISCIWNSSIWLSKEGYV